MSSVSLTLFNHKKTTTKIPNEKNSNSHSYSTDVYAFTTLFLSSKTRIPRRMDTMC